ncbi:complement regulatory protein [Trypanosoma cruzi]|nr:complement regulatory protein [Trypanosoma cruzi]
MQIAVDFDASFVACAGRCGWLPPFSVGTKGGEERGSVQRVTFPAGVMRAVCCDCCGVPYPFGVRFSAVVPCVCACHLSCACVLGTFFWSVGRPPSVYGGLCEWARADEGQGAWNEGMD